MKVGIYNSNIVLQKILNIGNFDEFGELIYPDTHYVKITDIDIPFCKAQFINNCEKEFDIKITFSVEDRWIRVDISSFKDNSSKLKTLLNIIYKHQC